MPKKIELLPGTVYGSWTVLGPGSTKGTTTRWKVACACGAVKEISGHALRNGVSSSCHSCAHSKHRLTKTPTYGIWTGMRYRCSNPKFKQWKDYGGRGITVCERWLVFENFLSDMGPQPTGMQLERKNNDLGYYKENCVWASPKQNMRNRRDTRFVEYKGTSMSIAEASERSGITHGTITKRLNRADGRDIFRPVDQSFVRRKAP